MQIAKLREYRNCLILDAERRFNDRRCKKASNYARFKTIHSLIAGVVIERIFDEDGVLDHEGIYRYFEWDKTPY